MSETLSRSYNSALLEVIPAYRKAGETWPATTRQLAVFAVKNRYWHPGSSKLISLCVREIGQALRAEKHTDPQGRSVRTMHAATCREIN